MSDKEKNVPEVDNWTKNAEEHGRLAAQLAEQGARLEMLTQAFNKLEGRFEKLEDGQTDLRKELVGQINEKKKQISDTNKRIDDTNKRIDDLRIEMINQFSSLKDEARQERETFRKEIRAGRRWLIATMITLIGLALAALTVLQG